MAVTYPDTRALPVAQLLMRCLCAAVLQNPKPPAICGFRIGDTGNPLGGLLEDECCDGLAFVRVGRIYPTFNVPNQNPEAISCALEWAVELEMGIWRCVPVGTASAPPSQAEWDQANTDQLNDWATLRDALCCFLTQRDQRSVGVEQWAPKSDPDGGCFGSSLTLTAEIVGGS
jgi:hypothetical protein